MNTINITNINIIYKSVLIFSARFSYNLIYNSYYQNSVNKRTFNYKTYLLIIENQCYLIGAT